MYFFFERKKNKWISLFSHDFCSSLHWIKMFEKSSKMPLEHVEFFSAEGLAESTLLL